ncbi:hypothetical protein Patl1_29290 [Pistacia atlantica]|uniref:Uncharacterized protein n=1 Tax=Pistacia atlantica TaxID=434234 RepID=A0ACC1BHA9_9ROSI|nr:hypothetical protein Patl1_29290 [Pistacia atlantica]
MAWTKKDKPRGWVFANNGEHLRIGVPIQTRYPEIVSHEKGTNEFSGFCFDVFYAALKLLPYALPHNLVPFDAKKNYKADDLLQLVTAGEYHAAVAKIFASLCMFTYSTLFFSHNKSRLVPLNSPEEFEKALTDGPKRGGVAAVVDERAYMGFFLSTRRQFSIIGHEFTRNGWGFAFPRDSPLAVDMSTAILHLSENGDLQRIHDKWLLKSACSSQGTKHEVDQLHLNSFWGLFVMCVSQRVWFCHCQGSSATDTLQVTMRRFWLLVLMIFYYELFPFGIRTHASGAPNVVNIGALIAFKSTVGKVAKLAIEAAVEDVNSDPTVLGGAKLNVKMQDTNHSGILGFAEALTALGGETVAIIGPQDSVTAHVVSQVADDLKVPLLSFSAADPTLSSLQFPFFVRTTQNDLYQMAAIAEIVNYYDWREVIAIYGDDDYGRNGIAALGDKLAEKRCKISLKAPLSPQATQTEITDLLVKVALAESRILIVHTFASWGPVVFRVAQHLGMMGTWLCLDCY